MTEQGARGHAGCCKTIAENMDVVGLQVKIAGVSQEVEIYGLTNSM